MEPHGRWWTGPLDAEQLARSSVERARTAAAEVAERRGADLLLRTAPELIAAAFASLDHLRIDGRAPQPWAELSGFFATRDGWVRLHGNYPHHAEVLRTVLGAGDRAGLERRIARLDADEVSEQVTAAGGIASAVRTREEWARHPHAAARGGAGWALVTERGERPELPRVGAGLRAGSSSAQDLLAGVRVLDLTRVIAGPSGTQLLACLGAEVLRVHPPQHPEILDQHLSTGMGIRSAVLDLRNERDTFRELAAQADVIVCGYRPGALARHGAGIEELEHLAPQAVIVSLSAWGESGPWAARAGFDSIVQAATGIAVDCGMDDRPGALPVQALDHATGQLLAAHVMESLARAQSCTVRLSLLGAAETLLALPAPPVQEPVELAVPRVQVRAGALRLDAVPPPLLVDGQSIERPVGPYGGAAPRWEARAGA